MRVWTYKQARDKIKADLDLAEEDFIAENEFVEYFNAAIGEAEAEIHTLYEDYFLTKAPITMVKGQADYDLPSNIYALKIRGLVYHNGALLYPVTRVRGSQKFLDIAYTEAFATSDEYRYIVRNDSIDTGYKINLIPAAREDGEFLTLWFLRDAKRIPLVGEAKDGGGNYTLAEVEATKIDIPQFINFVMEMVKGMCMAKENEGKIPAEQMAVIQQQRAMMTSTLEEMAPDEDNTIVPDFSHYAEHE